MRKKQFHPKSKQFNLKPLCASLLLAFSAQHAYANPMGAAVVNGQASFATKGNTLTVTNTPNAIINWQGFSIGANEITRFAQQSASSAVLNRVIANNPSNILGSLQSNGRVFLVNPSGIVFGANATVNVAGMVASTLNISNADFLAGRYKFSSPLPLAGEGPGERVSNAGSITAETGGQIYLIAPNVENTGIINAPNGEILLAAGHSVELVNSNDPNLRVNITAPAGDATNVGQLVAESGSLGLFGAVVKNTGTVSANSATMQGGKIVFKASQRVDAGGTISATTTSSPDKGRPGGVSGTIHILADMQVGTVNVTGTLNANAVRPDGTTSHSTRLSTNASQVAGYEPVEGQAPPPSVPPPVGEGSTTLTTASLPSPTVGDAPVPSPTGGGLGWGSPLLPSPLAGEGQGERGHSTNGGFIETSAAHVNIADTARVTTASAMGLAGTWLIDPFDFTIAATGGNMTGAVLTTNLAGGNISILSTTGTTGTLGDVNVNDTVTWSANQLTLNARNNININSAMYGSGTASLALEYGQQAVAVGNGSNYILNNGAQINLSAGNNFSTKLGSNGVVKNYTVITGLGAAGSVTAADLQGMNGGLSLNYALGGNIDATGTSAWNTNMGFTPVGDVTTPFSGTFDGLGHTVSGLTINRPATNGIGLFGYGAAGTTIKNVGMVGVNISGKDRVGGLIGQVGSGTVSNSYATGNVTGSWGVGGLVGFIYSGAAVRNSYAASSVSGTSGAGGLVGTIYSNGTVSNSYAMGNVSGAVAYYFGGLVGFNYTGGISNSYATGNVSGSGLGYVGGLVGENQGSISNSYATGSVTGSNYVGGLVGNAHNSASDSNSYWNTTTSGKTTSVGGTGLTTTQMQTASNFTGFNFTTTPGATGNNWVMVDADGTLNNAAGAAGATYPMLASEYSTTINNAHQLQLMEMAPAANYTLGSNIDAAKTANSTDVWGSAGFVPIGNATTQFTGIFDGLNHTVSNLTINRPTAGYVGLFGFAGTVAVIKNVGMVGGSVSGNSSVGALVGTNFGGAISNSYATGNVSGDYYIGGLVGANSGMVSNSHATGNVSVSGGFSFFTFAGGLVGYNIGMLSNNYATGNVSGFTNIGGLVGWNYGGTISNSYATGSVSGVNNIVGGLVGNNSSITISSTISNSFATGSVSGSSHVGGLVGANNNGTISSTISNSYATGSVSGSSYVGGLVGTNSNGTIIGAITNSFWNTTTSGQASSEGGTGLTTADMMKLSSFSSWNAATPNTIANTGGSGATWRIYEGHTAPLLTSFLTPLTLTGALDATVTYNGAAQSGAAFTLITNVLGAAASGTNAGFYNGYYSNQQGYDLSGGNLTINAAALSAISMTGTRAYDGTADVAANIFTLSGLVGGQTLVLSGTGTVADKNVGVNKPVTLGSLALGDGTGLASNYTFTGGTQVATITAANLTVSGIAASNKVYNGTTAATLTGTAIVAALGGDVVTVGGTGSGTFADKNVGTGKAVTVTGYTLGGTDAGNYTIVQPAGVTANITQLASVAWMGGASGNWSTAANWAGGALPDGANVAAVTIPSGVTVTYDSGVSGTTTLNTLTSSGTLAMAAGTLSLGGASSMAALNLSGGTLNSPAGLTVNDYTQTAGTLNIGGTTLLQSAGSMTVNGAIASNVGGALTLQAANNILLGAGGSITGTVSPLNVILNSDSDGLNGGAISLATGTSISSGGGSVTLGGGVAGNGTGNAIGNATYINGIYLTGATLNAGGGNIALNGTGFAGTSLADGIYVTNTSAIQTSGTGTITLNGAGGAGTNDNNGVRIGTTSSITAVNGAISLTGQGGISTGTTNMGVYVHNGATITATGTGAITLNGTGGSTGTAGGSNRGLRIASGAVITSNSGNIGIIGQSGYDGDGVQIVGASTVQSTSGGINITGTSSNGPGADYGVYITASDVGSGNTLITSGGNILINGTSNVAAGSSNRGLSIGTRSQVIATGTGNINMTGVGGLDGDGINMGTSAVVQANTGTISLTGTSGTGASADRGIYIGGSGALIQSAGDITLTGTSLATTNASNHGIYLFWGSINSTGGNLTLNGTSQAGASNYGINIYDPINSAGTTTLNSDRNILIQTSQTPTGNMVLRADMNGTGVGTVTFSSGITITSAAGKRTDLYYNPTAYATPTNYSANLLGAGTSAAWMLVNDVTQLQAMNTNLAGVYALGKNIDATATSGWNSGLGFSELGTWGATAFTGKLDGLGHTISNLTINRPGTQVEGLFGWANGATISNVGIVGGTISAQGYAGGLVGISQNSTISNSSSSATVSGGDKIGGLVGWVLGGGTVTNSYATGTVTGAGNGLGGLIGYVDTGGSTISYSYATGTVTGTGGGNTYYVGGLVGGSDVGSTYNNVFATGNLVSSGAGISGAAGGLIGSINTVTINNGYATGNVQGNGSSNGIGGLIGNAGGGNTLNYAYSTGTPSGTNYVGGLIGNVYGSGTTTITGSYWNTTTSGPLPSHNVSNGSATGSAVGKTSVEMMTMSTFTGWDIANTGGSAAIWRIYEGSTAPLLRSFLTPITLTPVFDGSASQVLTNIHDYTSSIASPNLSYLISATPGLILSSSTTAGSYTAALNYTSTQQGYDISETRTITGTGSASNDLNIINPFSWGAGSLSMAAQNNININANLAKTGAGTDALLFKANNDIVVAAGISSTTGALNVTLNSDSDASGGGAIWMQTNSSITSNGGAVTLSGGLDPLTGYAQGRAGVANYSNGIILQNVTINSGGGDVTLRGKGATAGALDTFGTTTAMGILTNCTTQPCLNLDSGTGKISLTGVGQETTGGNTNGIWLVGGMITSASPAADAITFLGDASAVNNAGWAVGMSFLGTIQTTAGGGISLTGIGGTTTGANSTQAHGLGMWSGANILSNSGNITLTGTAGSAVNGSVDIYQPGYIGQKAGTDVLSSTSNITLNANTLALADANRLQSSGALTIAPHIAGTSVGIAGGAGTLSLPASYFTTNFINGFSGITIGSATTGTITANTFTFSDNLTLWAGDANANATLSGAIANAGTGTSSGSLTVKAAGSITLGSNTSITTHAQPVVFWADSDNSGLGNITGGDYINIATNGGQVVLAGGADDGSYSGTTAADGIPDGYATGVNAANAAGIVLGQSTAYLAGNINISSSGGNIIMRGKSYSGTDIPGAGNAFGVGFYGQPIINSGAGTLLIDGQSVTADADAYAAGLQTSGYGSGAATFTSANTTANAIKLIGSSASGNADTAPGLNAGVNFNDSTSVTATGTGGGITITGSSANGYGVHLGGWGGNQTIQTTTGAIAIDGGSRGINTQSVAVPTGFTVAIASTSGGGITLTGDAMNLERSSSSSSGTLTIQPKTTGASIGIAGGAGTLSLPASYFTTNFVNGFSGITVGSATAGNITANTFTFSDNLTLWAGNADANVVLSGAITDAGADASSGSLTVKAAGNITSTAALTTQAQSVVFNSDSDASGAGAIMLNTGSSIASNGGNITLGGGSGAISAGVGFARGYNAAGYYNGVTVLGNLTAAGGNIVINGIADAVTNGLTNPVGVGVSGGSTASTTGAGTITLTGQSLNAGAGTVQTWGVEIGNYVGATSGTVTSVNGAILINGTAGSASNPIGSIVVNGSTVQATGTGSVTINGTAGNGLAGSQSRGIDIQGGASVLTNSGILNLNGVNTSTAASFGTIQGVVINGFGGDSKVASTSGAINIIGSTVNGVGTGVVIELPIVATKIGNGTSGDILLRSLNGTGITLTGAAINTLGNVTLDAVGGGAVTQASGSIIASSLELLGAGAAYTLNSPSNNVSNLSANTGSISFNNSGSFTVAPAGAAKFGYTANYGSGTVSVYTIDPVTGAMTLGTPVAAGTNPGSVTVAPGGKFAYVASYGSNNVSAYSIDPATGALTVVGTVASGGTGASVVTIDPSGRFAFVTNAVSNNVSVYSINSTSGALTAVGTPIAAGTGPRPITVDPTGRFVYVTNDQSNNISVYSINSSTGALTAVGTPVATGTAPRALTVDPSGRFAYVANNTSGNVSAYSIDQVTGALTATGTPIAAGGDAYSITADPSGKFVYVLNWSANNISAFSINQSTGALTAIGTPIGAGGDAYAITVDPSGKFAYVANGSVNVVSKFDINSTTGALTAAGSAPTGGAWSVSLAGGGGRVGGITATGNVSLTSGGVISGSGAVNVSTGTFTLGGGTWNQVAATLPGFTATDFRIAGGTFIRALSGDGTTGTPYQLADIYGVQGMGSTGMLGKTYNLANNIDASGTVNWNAGAGFVPVGNVTTRFTGTFDGLGHTISNLTINLPATNNVGLFGNTAVGSATRNVGLVGGSVSGADNVGGLVGVNSGTISNSYATGNVSGTNTVGGLVGFNYGNITDSYTTGIVSGGWITGGLVAYNSGTISRSYSSVNVTARRDVGGLAGASSGTISNSYATGNVTFSGAAGGITNSLGSLVGVIGGNSVIANSYATGRVSSLGGGLVAWVCQAADGCGFGAYVGSVSNSYWNSQTVGQGDSFGHNLGTALTTAQMMQLASFASWNTATPNTIANTGGSGATWRIYEGHTAPLLTSFLTPLTLTGAPDATVTYNGAAQSGGAFTLITNVLGPAASGTNVGFYNGYYSTQQGYDLSGGNLTINAAALSAISMTGTRAYDGTANVNANIFTLSGLVGGQTLVLSGTGTIADKNVGTNKTVTLGSLALGDGTGLASNYTFTGGTQTATITAAAITLSTGNVSKTYDGLLTAAGVATVTGGTLFSGDTLSGGTFAFTDKNVGSGNKTVTATGITVNDGNSGGNYSVSYASNTTSTITARALTVTAAGTNKVYDGTTAAAVTLSDNRISGDVLTDTYTGASFADKNAATGKAVSVIGITLTGTDAGNYTFNTTASTTANITQAALTLSTGNVSKTYDGLLTAAGVATVTGGTLFSGDTLSGGTFAFTDKNVGSGNKTVT
ncbi:MAG: beta-propeller fold lactonase family protein, partial [Gallionella sp.]|nr:beta-propeller fold lactonase family protein [Gallionella sp.]